MVEIRLPARRSLSPAAQPTPRLPRRRLHQPLQLGERGFDLAGHRVGGRPRPPPARDGEVDAIGADYLLALNTHAAELSSRGRKAMPKQEKDDPAAPVQQNIYVMLPEEKPSLGPNDVVAIVNDDIRRSGRTKQLIK